MSIRKLPCIVLVIVVVVSLRLFLVPFMHAADGDEAPLAELLEQLGTTGGDARRAARELLARGPEALPALREHIQTYPRTPELSTVARGRWIATGRAKALVRLLDDRAWSEANPDVDDAKLNVFAEAAGLETEAAADAFREMYYPNQELIDLLTQLAGVDVEALPDEQQQQLRQRFDTAFAAASANLRRASQLDTFLTKGGKTNPAFSQAAQGDVLALLYARVVTPPDWTAGWWKTGARRELLEKREAIATVGKLETTLKQGGPIAGAISKLLRPAVTKAETLREKGASLTIVMGSRQRGLTVSLATDILRDDIPAYIERLENMPDPLTGKLLGTIVQAGPNDNRRCLSIPESLPPGQLLVAIRNEQFVSWLEVIDERGSETFPNRLTWQRDWAERDVEFGDTVLLAPQGAVSPRLRADAYSAWGLAIHGLFLYGDTEAHAELLRRALDQDAPVAGDRDDRNYRFRNLAVLGIARIKKRSIEELPYSEVQVRCPFAGYPRVASFGEGPRWQTVRRQIEFWFDSAVNTDSDSGNEGPVVIYVGADTDADPPSEADAGDSSAASAPPPDSEAPPAPEPETPVTPPANPPPAPEADDSNNRIWVVLGLATVGAAIVTVLVRRRRAAAARQ